jgi:hypothetical protein
MLPLYHPLQTVSQHLKPWTGSPTQRTNFAATLAVEVLLVTRIPPSASAISSLAMAAALFVVVSANLDSLGDLRFDLGRCCRQRAQTADTRERADSLIAAANLGAAACHIDVRAADPASTAPPPVVSVVSASNECFSAAVEVTGFLVPRVESVVRLEPDGSHLTEVLVGEGDTVSAGQVMARLARPTFALPNAAAEAAMRPGAGAPTEAPTRPGFAGEPPARGLPNAAAETAARTGSTTTAAAPNAPAAVPGTMPIRAPVAGRVIESTATERTR